MASACSFTWLFKDFCSIFEYTQKLMTFLNRKVPATKETIISLLSFNTIIDCKVRNTPGKVFQSPGKAYNIDIVSHMPLSSLPYFALHRQP